MEKDSSSSASGEPRKRVTFDFGVPEKQQQQQRRVKQKSLDDADPKISRCRSKKKKKYCDMTKDEIINLCNPRDRPRAWRVVDDLRTYLQQISESEGFDMDVYPGEFFGVTTIRPVEFSSFRLPDRADHDFLAKLALSIYNQTEETEFEFVEVESVNACMGYHWKYYITFLARNLKANGDIKTFQTIAVANGLAVKDILLCRLKA